MVVGGCDWLVLLVEATGFCFRRERAIERKKGAWEKKKRKKKKIIKK